MYTFFYTKWENIDIYIRSHAAIIDFTIAVLKKCSSYYIDLMDPKHLTWNFDSKHFTGNNPATIDKMGFSDETQIIGVYNGYIPCGGERKGPQGRLSSRSIGVQTVAKPGIPYPPAHPLPPPPHIDDPPPVKT